MKTALAAAVTMLLAISIASAAVDSALVMLDVGTMKQTHEVVALIERTGGRTRIVYPSVAIIADGVSPAVDSSPLVTAVHRQPFDSDPLRDAGNPLLYHVALAWMRTKGPRTSVDRGSFPALPFDDVRVHSREGGGYRSICDQPGTGTATNVGFCDETEYMAGTVAVDVVMPESDGSINPSTEDWTSEEEAEVVAKMTECMDWWVERATEHGVPLTFFLQFHYRVPTGYEPISNQSQTGDECGLGDEYLWKNECLDHLGVSEDCLDGEHVLLNATRDSLQTDWAFAIWAVDSSNDEDGKFADGFYAYAFLGGPSFTVPTSAGSPGMFYLGFYAAHETGHIFWAFDQYTGAYGCSSADDCTKTTGYLDIENQNCNYCASTVPSIMKGGYSHYLEGALDEYAAGQVGWIDSDSDGIQDVLDLEPIAALYPYAPNPTQETTVSYAGSTHIASGYPNANPYHIGWPQIYGVLHDINVNKISSVEWRVDDGEWAGAQPTDGAFGDTLEFFTFEAEGLVSGPRVFSARCTNTAGNLSATSSDTLLIEGSWSAITSGPLGTTLHTEGVSWGDYDGDGDLDLYVANDNEANQLLWNDGLGGYSEDTGGDLADVGNGLSVSWGDYNNDGRTDLYLGRLSGSNLLFENDGGGSFRDVTASPLGVTGATRGAPWVDYDRNGHLDIYVVNEGGGANVLLRSLGDGTFEEATPPLLAHTGLGECVAWGDCNNDGWPDAYLANWSQPNVLYLSDGAGGFIDATSAPLDDAGNGTSASWGDYDNDGDLDLFLCNSGGSNRLLCNKGGGSFSDSTSSVLGMSSSNSNCSAWADVDNDGDLDLYVSNNGQVNALLLNDGEGGFSDGSEYWLANTGHGTGAAWADYDLDGDLDLYLGNWGDPNVLIVNGNTEGNHWLELELEGTVSNRSAIGTRVRAVCGGLSQIREVTGGTGYASQGAPVVHFGLGSSSLVDTLVIKWPSGSVETWRNVTADVVFKIVEGDPTGVEDWIPDQRAVSFSSCRPNPFADGTRFVYALPSACNVSACVYDVSGRLVRTLLHLTQQEAGAHVLKWNGRNDSGTRVASGVYMCRVEACGASAACKAVITR